MPAQLGGERFVESRPDDRQLGVRRPPASGRPALAEEADDAAPVRLVAQVAEEQHPPSGGRRWDGEQLVVDAVGGNDRAGP